MTTLDEILDRAATGPQAIALSQRRDVRRRGVGLGLDDAVEAGDVLSVGQRRFRVVEGLAGFLFPALMAHRQIRRRVRLHCGLHKNLTMFTRVVYKDVAAHQRRRIGEWHAPFLPPLSRTFFHDINRFYLRQWRYSLTSLSGQRVDLDSFDNIRVVRFVRDPRDLLVSGYHYHKGGGQKWCRVVDAKVSDYATVNGAVPKSIRRGQSFETYLNEVDLEAGLAAELEFRRPHFESMMSWPLDDPRVLTLRYEDIMGQEAESFGQIGDHFGWSAGAKKKAMQVAWDFSSGGKEAVKGHMRNKAPGQWRDTVPDAINDAIVDRYGAMLDAFGYPRR